MKFGYIYTFCVLTVISQSSAYVEPIEIDNIKFKFVDNEFNDSCANIFKLIPSEYKEGLKQITILPYSNHYVGLYWWISKSIYLYNTCDIDVVIHEVAHHCQYLQGDTLFEGKTHGGNFDECEDNIWNDLIV